MGNASRVAATLESLQEWSSRQGLSIDYHLASWGAGYKFLEAWRAQAKIPLRLISLRPPLFSFLGNSLLLRREIRKLSPDLILLDSDYHFPAYVGLVIPRVYLGQATDVVERARKYGVPTLRQKLNYFFKEKLDAVFQRLIADVIIAPTFRGHSRTLGPVQRVPLIVRREFRAALQTAGGQRIGVLLSGSRLERSVFASLGKRADVQILEDLPSSAAALDRCRFVFVQGGLSSIAECIARRRFAVVFPMVGHPEQILNAREVEELGLGIRADSSELQDLPRLLARIERAQMRVAENPLNCTGAEVAARILGRQLRQGQPEFGGGPFFQSVNGFNTGARASRADF